MLRDRLRAPSRYVQIGALCALLNNGIVILLDHQHVHYILGVPIAFCCVMIVSYLLHTRYTFGRNASVGGFLRFITANLTGFPLSLGAMFVLCDVVGVRAAFAMPIATMLLLCWNYVLAYCIIARPVQEAAR